MTSKLFIHLYGNYVNINDNTVLQKYQEKKGKEQMNDINEKINKINLNDKKFDIK